SINKVWTSEALAYAVDEAVQVFGGNGYSRDFPVERAYRDARITRIYEGTNEINRLIIPQRLLKQSPGLFTPDAARQALIEPEAAEGERGPLAAERELLARGKRLALAMLGCAADVYGASLQAQEAILGHAAAMIIESDASERAIVRAERAGHRDGVDRQIAVDMAAVYASDAADRIGHSAKQVASSLAADGGNGTGLTESVCRFAARASIDTISARRRRAAAVIEAGRYPF